MTISGAISRSFPCFVAAKYASSTFQSELDITGAGSDAEASLFLGTGEPSILTGLHPGLLQPGTYDLGTSNAINDSVSVATLSGDRWQGDPSGVRSGVVTITSVVLGAQQPTSTPQFDIQVHGTFSVTGLVVAANPAAPGVALSGSF